MTRRTAFTLVEFVVLMGIIVILLSIFIPYLLRVREMSRRTQCANNLKTIYWAFTEYAKENGNQFPRVVQDPARPAGYTAFTGADDEDPFAASSTVQPNDVTASLWLLVRHQLLPPSAFICPSSDDTPDRMADPRGRPTDAIRRGNFRSPNNLSYSYASPFSGAASYKMNIDSPGDFALMADTNPGIDQSGDNVVGPAWNASALELSRANSRNHGKAGQNVLFVQGGVRFENTPYCGVGRRRGERNLILANDGDNIYTAVSDTPLETPPSVWSAGGFLSRDLGPAWEGDTYLVPTAQDGVSPPRTPSAVTSQPATAAATQPSTTQPATQP